MFRPIIASDQIIFNNFIQNECHGSELCFANIFAWKNDDELQIYHDDNLLIIKGRNFFFPPLVKKMPYSKGLDFIQEYCKVNKFPFAIYGITEKFLPFMQVENSILTPHPELDEYLYNARDLVTYSGKKFHSKRNLYNQFIKIPHEFLSYAPYMRSDIKVLIEEWANENSPTNEMDGIFALLNNLDVIHCFCDCIIIEGKVEAFAIGSLLHNIGIVLFEKANTAFPGIYAAIVHLVAQKHFQEVTYINRQEDMGIENLRKSKLSYNPSGFIKKWHLTYELTTQARQIYNYHFNDSPAYQDFFFSNKIKEGHYLEENKIIKSMLFSRTQNLLYHNTEIKAKIIFALATHPFYLRQGNMKQLLKQLFNEWYNESPLITLHPAIENFYQNLGFSEFDRIAVLSNDYLFDEKVNLNELANIFQQHALHYDIYEKRDQQRWQEIENELKLTDGKISYLIKKATKKIIGYSIYDGEEIIELVTDEALPSKPNNLLRIINLDYILRACSFIPEDSIQVVDNIISKNNILITGKKTTIITLTIEELTRMLFKDLTILIPSRY